MLDDLRLDKTEKKALLHAVDELEEEVYITGSRLNPDGKGGDIDILIFSNQNSLELSRKVSRKFFLECEEKIDVLVFDKANLTEEQDAFIKTLRLKKIK